MLALRCAGRAAISFKGHNSLAQSVPRVWGASSSARFFSAIELKETLHVDFPPDAVTPAIKKALSVKTANSKGLLKHRIGLQVKKFQMHKNDCGSSSVQIAAMTEKIMNLTRHFAKNKKDNNNKRGFQKLIAKRRRMMQYLMRENIVEFGKVVDELNLVKEASHLRAKK